MQIQETSPKGDLPVLPGADFADAWQASGLKPGHDAQTIAGTIGKSAPGWVSGLLLLRNLAVRPFGLKSGKSMGKPLFPVISTQPNRVVLGMDDRHLDFRLVVEVVATSKTSAAATATTYVKTHNLPGRLYLAVVRPFHRVIVPAMLRRAVTAAAGAGPAS